MNFVSQKEFFAALEVIQKALEGGQVTYGLYNDHPTILDSLRFLDRNEDSFHVSEITFIAPLQAAKNKLFSLGTELQKCRETVSQDQKKLEELEILERSLIKTVAILKE